MLNFSDLEDDLRQLSEYYVGDLDVWDFSNDEKDYYMLVIPQDPSTLADPYSFKAIDKMLDCIWGVYQDEFRSVNYISSATMEATDLPYFYIKLKGY